ncbi:hypothetical protein OEZ85_002682 [Tetradesmus obliquus]|uniref:Uncharacterized protein n=1 Tax=Tetradesmus obliquus TaxID=3088 RepID=A0ABY8TYF6_TETOB|nr:hypothetical protein OEZ85_002682 [Tetradesmus obliquus]
MALHGGIITKRPLCYTADGRLLLAPCGNDIRVYSSKSGEHIATLRGHEAEVTSVAQMDSGSSKLVLSSSLDGTLRQWDIQEGALLQTWTIGQPIESMVYSKQAGLAYVSVHYKRGQSGRVIPYQLPSGEEAPGRVKVSKAGRLVISASGQHVAAVDRNSLFVWAAGSSAAGRRAKPLNLPHTKPYTCAAFDASDSIIAAVGALCFSMDGSQLLSGGQEGVLVMWALPSNKRTYLPRLGGPLCGITTSRADPARFFVAQSDNTVRLVNTAAMSVELSIHGLRPPPAAAALAAAGYGCCCSAAASSPAGVVLQPGSGHLVLPAEHANLQFFDVARDRHVARLQVSPRNPRSKPRSSSGSGKHGGNVSAATGKPLTKSGDASRRYRQRQRGLMAGLEAELEGKLGQLQLLAAENEMLKLRASVLESTVASREYAVQPEDSGGFSSLSEQRLQQLTERCRYMFRLAATLNPAAYCQVFGRNLETGQPAAYDDSHWRQVIARLGLSEPQVRHITACAELYFPAVHQLQAERVTLQQQLQASGPAQGMLISAGLAPMQPVLDALATNLKKEHVMRVMLTSFVFGAVFSSLQKAKVIIFSAPVFPDMHAITCTLVKDALAQRAAQGLPPRFVFPHRHGPDGAQRAMEGAARGLAVHQQQQQRQHVS